jgi:SAM-dependent methyltransferase
MPDGTAGWDEYARFYDWENAQTMAGRDLAFWQRLVAAASGPVLELGAGTGRVTVPAARSARTPLIGIDLSPEMLRRGRMRLRRARGAGRAALVRGDIRRLPFRSGCFALVIAPYGILQSLLRERDLQAALQAVVMVLRPGGSLVLDLVADLPAWREYRRERRLSGWKPGRRAHITLIESVRQDRRRGLTVFEQEFVERRRGEEPATRRIDLAFRTISLPRMARRLEQAGLIVTARLGSYDGDPWTRDSETWILTAEKPSRLPVRETSSQRSRARP